MMSVEMNKIYEIAKKINESVSENNPRLRNSVKIVHEEGTILSFENAFLVLYYDPLHNNWGACEHPGEWLMVFTEHHGIHVYPIDDLYSFNEFQLVEIQKLNFSLKSFDKESLSEELKSRYQINETGDFGCDSGRKRFEVVCSECNMVVHSNTTCPASQIKYHEEYGENHKKA